MSAIIFIGGSIAVIALVCWLGAHIVKRDEDRQWNHGRCLLCAGRWIRIHTSGYIYRCNKCNRRFISSRQMEK